MEDPRDTCPDSHVEIEFDWNDEHCGFDAHELLAELADADADLLRATVPDVLTKWADADTVRTEVQKLTGDEFDTIVDQVDEMLHGGIHYNRDTYCDCSTFAHEAITEWIQDALIELEANRNAISWVVRSRDETLNVTESVEHKDLLELVDRRGEWTRLRAKFDQAAGSVEYTVDGRQIEAHPLPSAEASVLAHAAWDGDLDVSYGELPSALDRMLKWPPATLELTAALWAENTAVREGDQWDVQIQDLNIDGIEEVYTSLGVADLDTTQMSAATVLAKGWTDYLSDLVEVVKMATAA